MNRKYTNKRYLENNPGLRAPRMEHIRQIKPEFFSHEGVATMSPLARLAWIGIWLQADKFGRFPWRPKLLKTKILPYDNVDFDALLGEMLSGGFIEKYTADGEDYGLVVHWSRHQGPGTHEQQSAFSYPSPPEQLKRVNSSGTVQEQFPHQASPVGVGVEVGVGVRAGVGKEVREGEGVTSAAGAAADEKALSPSVPARLKPARYETATPKPDASELVAYIMERSKALRDGKDGKPQFSNKAKEQLRTALLELGNVSKQELTEAIQAKLKLCNFQKDPTSYVLFGSTLASDLVATVHDIRRHKEAAEASAQFTEILNKQFEWKEQCYAAAEDLSINLEDWLKAHTSPVMEAIENDTIPQAVHDKLYSELNEEEATLATAHELREKAKAQQSSAQAKPASSADDTQPPTTPKTPEFLERIGEAGEHQGHRMSSKYGSGRVWCFPCKRYLTTAEAKIAWPMESVAAD